MGLAVRLFVRGSNADSGHICTIHRRNASWRIDKVARIDLAVGKDQASGETVDNQK
jgi:hypothetical protein